MSPARRLAATAVGAVLYAAVLIAGLGIVSLFLDEDVIVAPGLGQLPGVLAVAASIVAVAVTLWARMPEPGIWATLGWAALAAFLGYLGGLGAASVVAAGDVALALSAVGRAATAWPGLVVIGAAVVAAAMALAVARGADQNARWPWEGADDE